MRRKTLRGARALALALLAEGSPEVAIVDVTTGSEVETWLPGEEVA